MKRLVILGSTGSIGQNTIQIARRLSDRIKVIGLSAYRSIDILEKQAREFKPIAVGVVDEESGERFKSRVKDLPARVYTGMHALEELSHLAEADLVVNALVGSAGIIPSIVTLEAGKDLAIANKESLVAAGKIIVTKASQNRCHLIPIDSEHSAIFQCVHTSQIGEVKRIILTASGGPFIDEDPQRLRDVTAREALRHPTWKMGKKVTIDSATLLNKGFEVIEAHWLFGVSPEKIEVVIERSSTVHSLVEFVDGTVMAILSHPDMRFPIQYALTYPERVATDLPSLEVTSVKPIEFEKPDTSRFPCLKLAYRALRTGGTAPAVLSGADEVAVEAFLEGRIGFNDIYTVLEKVLDSHVPEEGDDISTIVEADKWAKAKAAEVISRLVG